MKNGLKIAIVGATGAVGQELLSILDTRKFPVESLKLFASARSVGKALSWKGHSIRVEALTSGCFDGTQVAFFDASDRVSQEWVPQAADSGAWVVDNSSTFRMENDIPLVVPEVNGDLVEALLKKGRLTARERILSGPNCAAAPLTLALKPIRERWGIRRVVVSTYQAVSGAGAAAKEELKIQTSEFLNGKPLSPPKAFTDQIAFNCLPHVGSFKEDLYTSEEQKIMQETRKILNLPQLRMTVTSVRVPTLSSHAESVNVECDRPISADEFREALKSQSGVVVQDQVKEGIYPRCETLRPATKPAFEAATGRDAVYVGRIRQDLSVDSGVNFWLVSDNLRKGAALNAVQIAELLVRAIR